MCLTDILVTKSQSDMEMRSCKYSFINLSIYVKVGYC